MLRSHHSDEVAVCHLEGREAPDLCKARPARERGQVVGIEKMKMFQRL
jgi:hypothetical protein